MNVRRRDLLLNGAGIAALSAVLPSRLLGAPFADKPVLSNDIPRTLIPPEKTARLLESSWRFHVGDIEMPKPLTHRASYDATKAGNALGAAAPSFDDGDWRTVDLPHDWAIEQGPIETENLAQGYRARGYAWYRRAFRLDPSLQGRYLELQIGGIATNATIWFNGMEASHNWSGYNSIAVDLTSEAVFGDALNSVAVRVDAQRIEGWWYEGAGIYRHVWLVDRSPVHIVTDGIHADPRLDDSGQWRLPVAATLYSIEEADAEVRVEVELVDPTGRVVGSAATAAEISPLTRHEVELEIPVSNPILWSTEKPNLYTVRTRVQREGAEVDQRITTCGFRSIGFDAGKGFFLNGKSLKIKGVCIHQDHAGVGMAVPNSLFRWRILQLKAMGCNAIRFSHNAVSTAFLDACDELGMLVMAENRLFNAHPDYMAQLEWQVRRDRNHPSIILWSVFNEEPSEATRMGYEMVRRMSALVKTLDKSRPVTAAMSSGAFATVNVSQAVDVVGFNYQQADYDRFHREFPDRPLLSSEDTSAFMTRGEWKSDEARRYSTSEDTDHAIWGASHRQAWKAIDTRPFVAGGFTWTGFDYYGEPTPFTWPANSSTFGAMDICGFPKSAFFIHRALWIKDRPILHILPHWNWQAGERIKVMVASNLESVELRLNGKIVGSGEVDPYDMITFEVPFEPGVLSATGLKNGKVVAETRVETAGAPVALRLTPSRKRIIGDGADAIPVTIEALDRNGRSVPTADLVVDFAISNGRLIGVGNGNPTSMASGKETHVSLFNGLAQAIVQCLPQSKGRLVIHAASAGMRNATCELAIIPASVPSVAPGPLRYGVRGWRKSPVSRQKPDRPGTVADNDMNSWSPVTPGEAPPFTTTQGYFTLLASITMPGGLKRRGGLLSFSRINGSADVWLNGNLAGSTTLQAGPFEVPFPPGIETLQIAVVIQAKTGERSGLPGVAFIQGEDVEIG